MDMLYDSDRFVVVYMNANEGRRRQPVRNGYEIVDKKTSMSLYLDGSLAEVFNRQIKAWQVNTPHQEEVEEVLEGYCLLAHYPLVMH